MNLPLQGSKKRHNLELDLFGGEPLMNWPVVEHVINYVRRRGTGNRQEHQADAYNQRHFAERLKY